MWRIFRVSESIAWKEPLEFNVYSQWKANENPGHHERCGEIDQFDLCE